MLKKSIIVAAIIAIAIAKHHRKAILLTLEAYVPQLLHPSADSA